MENIYVACAICISFLAVDAVFWEGIQILAVSWCMLGGSSQTAGRPSLLNLCLI